MSTGSKIVFGLFGGCCGAILLLIIGIALLPVLGKSYLDKAARTDLAPDEVAIESRKITLVQLPKIFKPKGLLHVDEPGATTHLLRVAYYEAAEGRGTVAIASILPEHTTPEQRALIVPRLKKALQAQGQLKHSFQLIDSRAVAMRVRGRSIDFYLSTGMDVTSKTRMWELFGIFPGERGPALLYMRVPFLLLGEDEILEMLRSIR